MMNKEEFLKLEHEAELEKEADACKQMHKDIHNEFVSIYNWIFDFCQENDLEPDPVIQIITRKLSAARRKQIKTDGYISKIYEVEE